MSPEVREGLDAFESRPTAVYWNRYVQEIVDQYEEKRGVVHGVQKDAIQNSWGARKRRKGQGWNVKIELHRHQDGTKFLSITDSRTWGLTGDILTEDQLYTDLPPDQRWSRFENLAFTVDPGEMGLGSRGRGKMVFIGASQEYTIMYDTLRDDGVYRFGLRYVEGARFPNYSWENDTAREQLRLRSGGILQPLEDIGTRVIIVNPVERLIEALTSGEFLRNISETWWEIIEKYDARIVLKDGESELVAGIPEDFALPESDSEDYKVWILKNKSIRHSGERYKIKKLHIIYKREGSISEDIKGISIQRGGMKIGPIRISTSGIPSEIVESIYGYIWLDERLEKEILEREEPTHYGYSYIGIMGKLKQFVEEEFRKFARKKLGMREVDTEARLRRIQSEAARMAIQTMNKITRKMGILGGRGPGPDTPTTVTPPVPPEPVRLEMPFFVFPGDTRRLNYGETLQNITVRAVNETDESLNLHTKLYLLHHDTLLEKFIDIAFELPRRSIKDDFDLFDIDIDESYFNIPGKYTIRAVLLDSRGNEIDKITRYFWVEEDPPQYGIFKDIIARRYPPGYEQFMGHVEQDGSSYIFYYNIEHPGYLAHSDNMEGLYYYLVRAMATEVAYIDINQARIREEDSTKLFTRDQLEDPLDFIREVTKLHGRIIEEFHSM